MLFIYPVSLSQAYYIKTCLETSQFYFLTSPVFYYVAGILIWKKKVTKWRDFGANLHSRYGFSTRFCRNKIVRVGASGDWSKQQEGHGVDGW